MAEADSTATSVPESSSAPVGDTSKSVESSASMEETAESHAAATTLERSIAATLGEGEAEGTTDSIDSATSVATAPAERDINPDDAMKDGAVDPTIAAATGAAEPASLESTEDISGSRPGSVQPDFLASVPGSPMHPIVNAPALPSPSKLKPSTKSTAGMSRVAQLNARIERDPLDADAQLALIADAEQKGDLERTREVYENFLKVFPDAAKQWIAYCDLELSHGFFERVQDIFIRCLRPSCSVALWKFYLDFVRRRNPIDASLTEQAKQARSTITKSFEFALSHIGQDPKAGEIWLEYINFLKEGGNRGTWEDQQKMDALRKTYQRAVQIPLNNVEQIWQEYNYFENNTSKMTAKRFVSELSPSYMTARKVLRELRAQFNDLSEPDLPERPDWAAGDRAMLEQWRKYLLYEESNPLDIEEASMLQQRIGFAYKKAVASLRFFPEIWYLAAQYNTRLGNPDEARILLHTGLVANSSSLLLAYTLAELEEAKGDFEACYKIYDGLIDHAHKELAELQAATEAEITEALQAFDDDADKETVNGENGDAEGGEKTVQEKEEVKVNITKRREPDVEAVKRLAANVWITEMRFARRAEGFKQARLIFGKARKSPSIAWQVWEASAMMEFHWNNEPKVATNIFELGLKHFSREPAFVLQYLNYLIMTNNPNNARALFERTVALVEPEKARAVWGRMTEYEYQYGDSLAAQKMFQRYAETFPEISPTERFTQRYAHTGLADVILRDLGLDPAARRESKRYSRSPSPHRSGKRGASIEPAGGRAGSDAGDYKRFKPNPEGSPAPSSVGGAGGDGPSGSNERRSRWGPQVAAVQSAGDDMVGGRSPRMQQQRGPGSGGPGPARLESKHAPALNRPITFMLDPRGDNVAVLPDAVVFFLSILPPANDFNGPRLNPATLVDLIGSTLLPGTAPGPGLPGERLGIPPRPKPAGGDAAPSRYGGGGGGGGHDGGYGQRRGGGGMGGGSGRRY